MRKEHLLAVNAARRERRAVILMTDLATGDGEVITEREANSHPQATELEKAFRNGKSTTIEVEGINLFLNVIVPLPQIVVIGAVHISQALATMAPVAGFEFRIIDPRTAFASPERFAGVDVVADWPEDVLKDRPLDGYTALVAVSHDPKIDDFPIMEALKAGCFFVGALGSRKSHAKRVERLMAAGVSEAQIARINAPIGLDINAQSPAEIAVSILAGIIQAFRRRELR